MTRILKRTFAPMFAFKGNPRYSIFTEPLWGIPFHLYSPFLTLYMFSLGLTDADIGILLSVGLVIQMTSGILGGILTDKFGRRKITFIFDIISWTIPCLIWAFAQDFQWFFVAAIFHAVFPVSANSWECLLVEDADPNKMVQLMNWIYIAGVTSVFFAPITGLLIGVYSLVPVMRVLLIIAVISMTAKFIIYYYYTTETGQGKIRLEETRGVSVITMLLEYKGVLKQIFSSPQTVRVLILIIVLHIQQMIAGNFFSLYITQNLYLPDYYLAWFPVLRGAIMLTFFLVFQHRLNKRSIYAVMLVGLSLYVVAYILLITTPAGFLLPLIVFVALDACAAALFLPRRDTLVINNIDPAERARIRGMLMVIMMGAASPFGYIAGLVSGMDRRIPFAFCIFLFLLMGIIVLRERSSQIEATN